MKTFRGKIIATAIALFLLVAAYTAGTGALSSTRVAADPVLYNPDTITAIYDKASPSVFVIDVTQQGTGPSNRSTEGLGSGFLVDNQGHILTNNHVVDGATTIRVIIKPGNSVDAKVVGTDPADDLAVVSVDPTAVAGMTPLQFADSSLVKPGQMAVAIGNPYGLTDSITIGIISGLNRTVGGSGLRSMLQTDAAMNPGNSGGPLLDANGMVIGINTAIESSATGAYGIGFAVPSNVATRVLPDLLAGKQVSRPWLGISGAALTQTLAQNLGLSVNQGVYVVSVVANSPAEKARLKSGNLDASGVPTSGGDVITVVDGKSVASVDDLSAYLNTKKVGDTVTLAVLRGGSSISVPVTLGAWPSSTASGTTPRVVPQPTPQPGIPGQRGRNNPQQTPTQ